VERATARFEKALGDASTALGGIGKDVGKGSQTAYRDLVKSLKTLQTNAKKTNQQILKDLEQLAAAVKPSGSSTSKRSTAKKSAAKKSTSARKTSSARKPAAKSAAKSTRAKTSTRKTAAKK
jgi:hypothetical protein